MIRYLVESLFVSLKIIKQKTPEEVIDEIIEALPVYIALGVMMEGMRQLFPHRESWYRKMWYQFRRKLNRARLVVVGY